MPRVCPLVLPLKIGFDILIGLILWLIRPVILRLLPLERD